MSWIVGDETASQHRRKIEEGLVFASSMLLGYHVLLPKVDISAWKPLGNNPAPISPETWYEEITS
jgi:hypothetical protein